MQHNDLKCIKHGTSFFNAIYCALYMSLHTYTHVIVVEIIIRVQMMNNEGGDV